MFFGHSFLCNASQPQLLPIPQLRDQWPLAVWIVDDRSADPLVGSHGINNQIASVNFHNLAMGGTLRMKGELDAAELTVLFAVAVAGVDDIVRIFGVQWN